VAKLRTAAFIVPYATSLNILKKAYPFEVPRTLLARVFRNSEGAASWLPLQGRVFGLIRFWQDVFNSPEEPDRQRAKPSKI
jgi:hypothetical protein